MQDHANALDQAKLAIKAFISPSLRFEIRQKKAQIIHFFFRLCFWKWQKNRFTLNHTSPADNHLINVSCFNIEYNGRQKNVAMLKALLGINAGDNALPIATTSRYENTIFVTDYPQFNCIRVPFSLITIVKLGRPIEDILASYSKSLRRSINAESVHYRYQAIDDMTTIEHIETTMLQAYATARHDIGAAQLDAGTVQKFAQKQHGRLDILLKGDEKVGCHLGNPYTRQGKRYWHVNRLGYPSSVFSDYKRWGEVNSINLHLALTAAIASGYDYCDYGVSLAKPGHGLIEWKRRRRGYLATHDNFNYFYLKLPKKGAAHLLWHTPLFGVESGQATLHLGVPADKSDDELMSHYKEMGYAGLSKVYLHSEKEPSMQFVASLTALFAEQDTQPIILTKLN